MMLIEAIKGIARFFICLIAVRDCNHCKNTYEKYGCKLCNLSMGEWGECESSVWRSRFERKCSKQ